MSDYNFPSYDSASDSTIGATGSMGGAAAAGAGINWGGAAATAGASAIGGILQSLYQAEQERKKKIEDIKKMQIDQVGDSGKNQQSMLQNMMQNWQGALK